MNVRKANAARRDVQEKLAIRECGPRHLFDSSLMLLRDECLHAAPCFTARAAHASNCAASQGQSTPAASERRPGFVGHSGLNNPVVDCDLSASESVKGAPVEHALKREGQSGGLSKIRKAASAYEQGPLQGAERVKRQGVIVARAAFPLNLFVAHAEHKMDRASGQRPRLFDRRSCWRARKSVAAAVLGEP